MSQSTLDDDDLFGEAADELRDDIEEHLGAARGELPDAESVWETDADNVLGVLNGLGAALDVGEAADHLRQAKKWYTFGEQADAFEDADDLAASIESVESVLDLVATAGEQADELTNTVPELRSTLQEFEGEE